MKIKREAEALPYYERLLEQFQQSEYLADTRKRIAEAKATLAARATATKSAERHAERTAIAEVA